MQNAKQVSCGNWYSLILDENGIVWGSGFNKYGQLGLGQNPDFDLKVNTFQQIANNVRLLADCQEEEITYSKSARNAY
jgi:alpha-tubulin suppressor-like RCC1 family protein